MPVFNVVVERRGPVQRATVPVEADTAEEAKTKAEELARTTEHAFAWFSYGLPEFSSTHAVPGLCSAVIPSRLKEVE